jgi:molecular chaperone IbpA
MVRLLIGGFDMRNEFDFSPYRRTTVGFDRLFDLLESATGTDGADSYPPFDLRKESDDRYEITLAVAGFARGELDIVAQQNLLVVRGRKSETEEGGHVLHRGIAARSFERRFQLGDFVEVDTARYENGLLVIGLRREVPETMLPRRIAIGAAAAKDRLESPREEPAA